MTVTERFVGKPVPRKEDPELLTGQASYVDNMTVPGMVWMALVRPPYVHARILEIDTKAAAAMPGVLAVFTGKDLEDDFAGSLPMVWPITDDIKMPVHWPLTKDKIRFNGDAVAAVLAETRAQAEDAAEAITVSVQELPPVLDLDRAGEDGATLVHEDLGTNAVVHWSHGGAGDQTVFETAEVVVEARYEQPRVIPNPMEPRSVLVQSVPAMGEFTVISATQIPHILKVCLSMVTGVPEQKLRVIAPDVGGGFGGKLNVYAEEALALALCRKVGRPVKWTETRSENYVAMIHGRGTIHDCTLAGTKDGTILGVKFVEIADMGAYYQLLTPGIPELGGWVYMGPYDPKTYWYEFTGVMTNRTPTDAYRGAGRPEATFVLERLVDLFAQRIGMDPAEVRRKNLVPKFLEARPAISGLSVDSGDYHTTFQMALDLVRYDERRREQARRRAAGDTKQLGIGICTYIEMCGLAPSEILGALKYVAGGWDAATIECLPTGKVIVKTGTSPHGQGHETSWAQVVADGLGVHVDDVEVLHGDTAVTPLGMDTYGSRSASVGGAALHFAMEKIREKARRIAAHELEVAEADVDWTDGAFRVKGAPDKARTIPQLAFSAWTAHSLPKGTEPHLNGTAVYDPPNFTWPGGAHICVVEVDVETGQTEIVEYVGVDDCGTIINPMIVEGQVHGGVAQGVAEALYEEAVYDEQGNLTTSSLVQYLVPSANEIPNVRLGHIETPSTTNPLGVKGIGEAGTIASPPAVVNAVEDAIAHLGVTTLQKPASPERVWRAIRAAKAKGGLQ
jgi:carbon-monoxide dehydrogenase large subunit